MKARRRFRPPVISRLTWAWLFFGCVAAAFIIYAATAGRNADSPARVALALGPKVETMAPPLKAQPAKKPPRTVSVLKHQSGGVKDDKPEAAPTPPLRDGAHNAEPPSEKGEDSLADASTSGAPFVEEPPQIKPSDVVITVDGAPAKAPGPKVVTPQSASLTAHVSSTAWIPDPDPALLQKTQFGEIPKIAADGRRASLYYTRPAEEGRNPRIAIIVGGLGLNPTLTERAIDELPPEVTLAFAPYAKNLASWTKRARRAGHEIMLELPMEGYGGGGDALGPAALTTERSAADNLQRLNWLLSRFGAYFGATNYLGGKFSADSEAMAPILKRLNALGLAYVDDTGAARRAMAGAHQAMVVNRMIGTGGDDAEAAQRDLAALEKIAARDGDALGKSYAYERTITAISTWAKDLPERELALAPASAVLQARRAGE